MPKKGWPGRGGRPARTEKAASFRKEGTQRSNNGCGYAFLDVAAPVYNLDTVQTPNKRRARLTPSAASASATATVPVRKPHFLTSFFIKYVKNLHIFVIKIEERNHTIDVFFESALAVNMNSRRC